MTLAPEIFQPPKHFTLSLLFYDTVELRARFFKGPTKCDTLAALPAIGLERIFPIDFFSGRGAFGGEKVVG